ncbi:MAG: spermidine synthase [Gammaproteobacteria bacterium]|jgi:predicted membrane-bound spermidine synthase
MRETRTILLFAALFVVSGFAGLIYESIWSHYLKLYLGHAAYAQTLVLAIFMGGMAIGAWIASLAGSYWKNLLFVYALVEGIIGALALVFHETYDAFLHLAYSSILPSIDSIAGVQAFKWTSAALLILPQSVLLGMTFPLMTAGILRCAPHFKGRVITAFYFANSIGASVGVLVSGFVLIDWFGLPGTIKTAGVLNILVAVAVMVLLRRLSLPVTSNTVKQEPDPAFEQSLSEKLVLFYLGLALATGLASFIYELSWIRMLSLVLGSSTHAFEMMLSAFIFGLALGSFWLRKRIDRLRHEVRFLAYAQLAMGFFALMTLPLYNSTFDMMQWIVRNVDKTDQGYLLFNLSSHALAMLVMLPTTFCAGLTLPLITHILLRAGYGERSIGRVYAFNTVGAIAGVLLTIHVLLPVLGLKYTLVTGALIDIVLGVLILLHYVKTTDISSARAKLNQYTPAVVTVVCLLLVAAIVDFNSYKMASGVYRHGNFYTPENAELLFHKDGKTASVDLVRVKADNEISIITNGKPDASINVSANGTPSPDEATMILAAALPLSMKPASRQAAIVGLGSGLTTHTLLSANQLASVDTVEIEPAIVEAAKGFGPRVSNAYNRPESHIYIDDAKSYFSTHNKKYDLIISEPSNPWVSGVASLFSSEFYALVSNYLTDDGIFTQWLQLYEIDMRLVASVMKALSQRFDNYVVYAANNNDIIIMATNGDSLGAPSARVFDFPELARELARVRVRNVQDLQLHYLGDKNYLDPLFASYDIRYNSDYYPVLDLNAIKTRFLKRDAMQILTLKDDPVKTHALWRNQGPAGEVTQLTPNRFYYPSDLGYAAMLLREFLINDRVGRQFYKLPNMMKHSAMNLRAVKTDCAKVPREQSLLMSVDYIAKAVTPFLTAAELDGIWDAILSSSCLDRYSPLVKQRLLLNKAIARGDAGKMSGLAAALLQQHIVPADQVLYAGMVGRLALNQYQQADQLWQQYSAGVPVDEKHHLLVRLIKAHVRSGLAALAKSGPTLGRAAAAP